MESIVFEFTGPPLSEITPGLWDLNLRDGTTVLAIVDRGDDGAPWWAPLGDPDAVVDCSTDWTGIVGAVAVGIEQLADRRPAYVPPAALERFRSMPVQGPVSISGRGRRTEPGR